MFLYKSSQTENGSVLNYDYSIVLFYHTCEYSPHINNTIIKGEYMNRLVDSVPHYEE